MIRGSQVPSEFTRGASLEQVLERHLLTVEQSSDGGLITSILLLSPDGRRLSHGAAPNLPRSYRESIDGAEIGPRAGSCGTAAYYDRPIYVTDIAADPLWADYRHLALPHGLRSCWSTPIRDRMGSVLGTFAIYHRSVGGPTAEEIEAIDMITEHVAHAILWARALEDTARRNQARAAPQLKLVDNDPPTDDDDQWPHRLLHSLERLESLALDLDRYAENADTEESRQVLTAAATDSRRLVSVIRHQLELRGGSAG
jgi:GAF domain-containing protein